MARNGNIINIYIACRHHCIMVHHITQVALFFYSLLLDVFRKSINFRDALANIVLVGKYHILPCYKTDQ